MIVNPCDRDPHHLDWISTTYTHRGPSLIYDQTSLNFLTYYTDSWSIIIHFASTHFPFILIAQHFIRIYYYMLILRLHLIFFQTNLVSFYSRFKYSTLYFLIYLILSVLIYHILAQIISILNSWGACINHFI